MVKSNPAQKKLKTEKGERRFPQILNLGEGLRGKNNGGRKNSGSNQKVEVYSPNENHLAH